MEPSECPRCVTTGLLTKNLERNEDLFNLNPQNGLLSLATGNRWSFISIPTTSVRGLRQADEDLSTYYLLTYSPTNGNYDGKFRNILRQAEPVWY